ncbi:hypothetical protein [Paenibacillus sp. J2TS4]|nr:hypothetical protein [Paenibacillus sp. J2TS4]
MKALIGQATPGNRITHSPITASPPLNIEAHFEFLERNVYTD